MKKLTVGLALFVTCCLPGTSGALICTIDEVPAATLLLPYFEVDIEDPNGMQTLMSINNASASAVLAHVVIWSDLSVPVLDFNLYLTGYDVQSINLRDIIVHGVLPPTASAAQDTGEVEPDPAPTPTAISNQGAFSDDVTFASCAGFLPPPSILGLFTTHLQQALTGKASVNFGGLCYGRNLGDNIARGYVTVDTVSSCNLFFPGDPSYFGPSGVVTNENVLWGDYFFDDSNLDLAYGDALVHIEAAPGTGVGIAQGTYGADPQTTLPGEYTFYGRYVGWQATDNREPLATTFAVRYLTGGPFSGGTDLLCWRDAKTNQGAFACPVAPAVRPHWYPLGQEGVVIFDEAENPDVPTTFPISPQPPTGSLAACPAEAQRVELGGPSFPLPFDFGWLYLDLNHTVTPPGSNPREDPGAAQAWVAAVMTAEGRYAVGFDAIQLDSACEASHFTPGLTNGVISK
jgi:hypothetical protein